MEREACVCDHGLERSDLRGEIIIIIIITATCISMGSSNFISAAVHHTKGACFFVYGDLPRQHSFGTTLRFTGPVPANSRQ